MNILRQFQFFMKSQFLSGNIPYIVSMGFFYAGMVTALNLMGNIMSDLSTQIGIPETILSVLVIIVSFTLAVITLSIGIKISRKGR